MDLSKFGGRKIAVPQALMGAVDPSQEIWDFGWVPGDTAEKEASQRIVQSTYSDPDLLTAFARSISVRIPDLKISGSWQQQGRRVCLWKAPQKVLGKFLPYIWQTSGSCVGAGGSNAKRTTMCNEILNGELEEYQELWWPFAYSRSRFRSGMRSPGEGSSGTSYAEAGLEDGDVAVKDAGNVPVMKDVGGWLQLDSRTEINWSDGDDPKIIEMLSKGRLHLWKSVARCRSKADCIAALVNGYCLTQASMFGMRNMVPSVRGTKSPRRIGAWDGSWSHQTFIDEFDENEEHGEIFRWGNNWGPEAHGAATADEPAGGVYLPADVVDKICQRGEVFAWSMFDGFPARPQPFLY